MLADGAFHLQRGTAQKDIKGLYCIAHTSHQKSLWVRGVYNFNDIDNSTIEIDKQQPCVW